MIVEVIAWAVAIVLAFLIGLVIRGFLPVMLRPDGSAVYHLSIGVILVLISAACRAIYWDFLPVALDWIQPGLWYLWHGAVGRPIPNILLGLIFASGVRHLLILQWLLIPEHERGRYSILTAPFYPQRMCIVRGVRALRRSWRKEDL